MTIKASVAKKISDLETSTKKARRDSAILFGVGLPSLIGGLWEIQDYMRHASEHHPEPAVAMIIGGAVGLFGVGTLSASALLRNWIKFDEKLMGVLRGVHELASNKEGKEETKE